MTATPSLQRRLVGTALRRYRELLGYGLDEPARVLDCDRSRISRIETGQRGIRPKERCARSSAARTLCARSCAGSPRPASAARW